MYHLDCASCQGSCYTKYLTSQVYKRPVTCQKYTNVLNIYSVHLGFYFEKYSVCVIK